MKVSFSRKGFDSTYGGQANAILPDGTMLPFPIPAVDGTVTYGELTVNNHCMFDIISEIKKRPKVNATDLCHLDPDLIKDVKARKPGWKPAFGQAAQALSELNNKGFGVGDLFLFFGWFKFTEFVNGKLRYKKGARNLHVIYGYLQVGEILKCDSNIPEWLMEHPHANRLINGSTRDAIYLPKDKLTFNDSLPGAGMLKFSEDLILTHPNESRSRWKLPQCFDNIEIGHSPKQPNRKEYYQSTSIGQEMIWEVTPESMDWLKSIIK